MTQATEREFPGESYDEAYYELVARQADEMWRSYRWRLRWIDEVLNVQPGEKIVDLGAGAGGVSKHLAERGGLVEAVDLSAPSVQVAQRRCEGLAVNFTVADAADCRHLESGAFDKVSCCDLIEHVHDETMAGIFTEACRLLKPGGLFYVYSPNRDHWIERMKAHNFILKNPVGHIRVRPIAEVAQALRNCGFELARVASPASMLPVLRWIEWLWIRLGVRPELAIYRVCILARKPVTG